MVEWERGAALEAALREELALNGPAKPTRWPSRRRRLEDRNLDPSELEDRERRKWLDSAIGIARNACFPLIALAEATADSTSVLDGIGSKLRGKTLRQKVKPVQRFLSWLMAVYSLMWPDSPSQVTNYAVELVENGVTRAVLRAY